MTELPPLRGRDAHALCRRFGRGADCDALEAAVAEDAVLIDIEQLARACPPERMGLAPGAYAALFGPLFGEFE